MTHLMPPVLSPIGAATCSSPASKVYDDHRTDDVGSIYSDLLSRHVNKCHANEKPLVNTSTRRKGSASTSRATTSKQACDQCVQSSLPCDGSNPCGASYTRRLVLLFEKLIHVHHVCWFLLSAKCVQRKYRCTYVKFHRQTAPVGPGHQPPRSTTSVPPQPSVQVPSLLGSGSSASSRYPLYSDDFVMSGSSAAAAASGSYPGHAQVSAALHDALYPSQSPTFPYASSLYSNGSAEPAEYPSRYNRSHEDLYRTSPTSSLAPSSASGSAPSSWVSGSATAGGWPPAGQHSSSSSAQQDYHHGHGHHASQLERPVYSQPQHTLAPHQQHGNTFIYYQ